MQAMHSITGVVSIKHMHGTVMSKHVHQQDSSRHPSTMQKEALMSTLQVWWWYIIHGYCFTCSSSCIYASGMISWIHWHHHSTIYISTTNQHIIRIINTTNHVSCSMSNRIDRIWSLYLKAMMLHYIIWSKPLDIFILVFYILYFNIYVPKMQKLIIW